jgi:hypothetical protein
VPRRWPPDLLQPDRGDSYRARRMPIQAMAVDPGLEVDGADPKSSALAVDRVDPTGAQRAAVDCAADPSLAAADPLCGLRDRQELGRRRGFAGNVNERCSSMVSSVSEEHHAPEWPPARPARTRLDQVSGRSSRPSARRLRPTPNSRKPRSAGLSHQADARTRTGDPFITSEVLCQLSYVGAAREV